MQYACILISIVHVELHYTNTYHNHKCCPYKDLQQKGTRLGCSKMKDLNHSCSNKIVYLKVFSSGL